MFYLVSTRGAKVIGRLSVKPWCYWLRSAALVVKQECFSQLCKVRYNACETEFLDTWLGFCHSRVISKISKRIRRHLEEAIVASFYYCQNPSGFARLLASRHIKVVNASLPVDVRSSETSLL